MRKYLPASPSNRTPPPPFASVPHHQLYIVDRTHTCVLPFNRRGVTSALESNRRATVAADVKDSAAAGCRSQQQIATQRAHPLCMADRSSLRSGAMRCLRQGWLFALGARSVATIDSPGKVYYRWYYFSTRTHRALEMHARTDYARPCALANNKWMEFRKLCTRIAARLAV